MADKIRITKAHEYIYQNGISIIMLAEAASVPHETARTWWHGMRLPGKNSRYAISRKYPQLLSGLWRIPVTSISFGCVTTPVTQQPPAITVPEPEDGEQNIELTPYDFSDVELSGVGAARQVMILQLDRVRRDVAALRKARADPVAIMKAEEQERKATLDLAKLAGELSPTEQQRLTRSAAWRALREVLMDALGNNPEVFDRVAAALEACDA